MTIEREVGAAPDEVGREQTAGPDKVGLVHWRGATVRGRVVRSLLSVGGAGVLAVALSSCSSAPTSATGGSGSNPAKAASTDGPGAHGSTTTTTTTTTAQSGAASSGTCANTRISAQLVGTASTHSQYELTLELANTGSSTCTMDGYPGFELVGPLSGGSTTYEPVHQVTSYTTVTLVPGASAHADLWALPGPDTCDDGLAWVPTGVSVTVPGGSTPVSVAWPGGSVDNCQGGATHPGTFVGPVVTGPTGP